VPLRDHAAGLLRFDCRPAPTHKPVSIATVARCSPTNRETARQSAIPFASLLRRWRFIIVGNNNELILLKVTDLLQAKQARALPV
jgi:hypothetical protein